MDPKMTVFNLQELNINYLKIRMVFKKESGKLLELTQTTFVD